VDNAPSLSRLAVHLFAICPNSASCERLFSAYGQILTDKRTSLLPSRMCDLAELKLHIRRELVANQERKSQADKAKRHFERQEAAVRRVVAGEEGTTTGTAYPGHSLHARPAAPVSRTTADTGGPGTSTEMDIDSIDLNEDSDRESPSTAEFRRAFDALSNRAAEEGDQQAFDPPTLRNSITPRRYQPTPLSSLFNFNSPFWNQYVQRTAEQSLQAERDILDYHLSGEPGTDGLQVIDDDSASAPYVLDPMASASMFL
jgi:hypothetical protein